MSRPTWVEEGQAARRLHPLVVSPWVRRALEHRLPAKETTIIVTRPVMETGR